MTGNDELPTDLIGTNEAARIAAVKPSTVREWIRRGTLRGWRAGGAAGRIRVSRADVVAVMTREPVTTAAVAATPSGGAAAPSGTLKRTPRFLRACAELRAQGILDNESYQRFTGR